MQENPYGGLIQLMQNEGAKLNPPSIKLGVIVATEPLHIKVDEQDLYADDVLVADYLTQVSYLEIGDLLALMPMLGEQEYIVLAKVVSL